MTVRDAACGLDHVTRINPRPDLRFYNLSLHQDAEADEVGYFRTVSKGSLLEWVDRMSTTPATFGERTVGTWINAVIARGFAAAGIPPPAVVQALRAVLRRAPEAWRVRRVRAARRMPGEAHPLLAPDLLNRPGGASSGLNPAAGGDVGVMALPASAANNDAIRAISTPAQFPNRPVKHFTHRTAENERD